MAGKTNHETIKVSLFKKVFSRHKRKGKDPNRIDDLLGSQNDCGVIDVARIQRSRVRSRNEMSTTGACGFSKETNGDNVNGEIEHTETGTVTNLSGLRDDFVIGEDLVVAVESTLTGIPGERTMDGGGQRRCCCFRFKEFPGVYWYPRALDEELQMRLAYKAVTEYCELGSTTAPKGAKTSNGGEDSCDSNTSGGHRTNIDLLPPKAHERVNQIHIEEETMWNLWKRDQEKNHRLPQQNLRQPTDANKDQLSNRPPPEKKAKHNADSKNRSKNHNQNKNNNNNYYRRFSKLSWATMGYHYDWTERSYHPRKKSKMPDLVAKLSVIFATATPNYEWEVHRDASASSNAVDTFTPSASIVNYYTTKSTMGGHRDDLEDPNAMNKPIVSVSLGLPGIFVLGGPEKDQYEANGSDNTEPSPAHPVRALLLRPGDVLVMGGASRLNYHAMARVLPLEAALEYDRRIGRGEVAAAAARAFVNKDRNEICDGDDSSFSFANLSPEDLALEEADGTETLRYSSTRRKGERDYLTEYLRHHRVNINVRQVYPDE